MNRKDVGALTLVGPTRNNTVLDPLPTCTTTRQPAIYECSQPLPDGIH